MGVDELLEPELEGVLLMVCVFFGFVAREVRATWPTLRKNESGATGVHLKKKTSYVNSMKMSEMLLVVWTVFSRAFVLGGGTWENFQMLAWRKEWLPPVSWRSDENGTAQPT